ncbi:MAG TPA: hypothetical protein VN654_28595 [Vicinamibacterales bacterium]|jgi:hypothetical protein|nr:hypothetical protein [Vicinamibacterales bacterium]
MRIARAAIGAAVAPRLENVSVLLLLCGVALGPHGLAILTPSALSLLDPAAPVGLAVFGIVAAMRVRGPRRSTPVAAALQAAVTGLVVAGAFFVARPAVPFPDHLPPWELAVVALGIAAATSSALAWDGGETSDVARPFTADDALLPIVAGGLLLALQREASVDAALELAAQVVGVAALVAACGWLMVVRASTTEERLVGTFACVLLLGGAADYLSMSALLCGVVAGAGWRLAGAATREHLRRDVTYAADSLLALVLVLAGAHADYSPVALTLAIAYTVLRAAGKLAGAWIARRLFPASTPPTARLLLAPGAFGVAFALNVVRALGDEFAVVLTVVVVGTIASSAVAAVADGGEEP